ncbi:hypothetical protein V8F20_012037 [Naviculisporaceae sp. PSN 640]
MTPFMWISDACPAVPALMALNIHLTYSQRFPTSDTVHCLPYLIDLIALPVSATTDLWHGTLHDHWASACRLVAFISSVQRT